MADLMHRCCGKIHFIALNVCMGNTLRVISQSLLILLTFVHRAREILVGFL